MRRNKYLSDFDFEYILARLLGRSISKTARLVGYISMIRVFGTWDIQVFYIYAS